RFGHCPLNVLKPEHGLRFLNDRANEGASAGTVRREWQVLTRILNLAVNYEKLQRNPFKRVELPEAHRRARVAEPEELEAIRNVKDSHRVKLECRHQLWRIILVALNV